MKELRSILVAGASVASLLTPPAVAQPQTLTAQEADIRAFIADVSRQTGRTFVIDPRVRGTVTIYSDGVLSEDEVYEVFLATLRANGLAAVPGAGGATIIRPAENLSQLPSSREGYGTEVFRLRDLDAAGALEILRPFLGQQGQIVAAPRSNAVIVADYRDNLARLRAIIGQVDREDAAVQTVTLRNSAAGEIANVLNRLISPVQGEGAPRGFALTIVPVPSSNSILLRGDPAVVARAVALATELDQRAESAADVRVVRLQHADAAQLLPVLQEVVGQKAAAPAGEGGQPATPASGDVRISRYPGANALVISADPETQRTLTEVIRQLDVRRAQVLVEAIVVEISDNAAKELGVQFLLAGREGSGVPFAATNFSDNAPNVLALTGALVGDEALPEDSETLDLLRDTAVRSLLGPFGSAIGFGGNINDALLGIVVNAVKRDDASNLLSTPSVMTLDNEEASILVGQEVPVSTGQVVSDNNSNPFVTIERRDIGVKLSVRPQINSGGAITLFLRQEVSSLNGQLGGVFDEPVFSTREIETTVLVDDGEIVALGGLLDDNEQISNERVPILGDIPVVGRLFRSTGRLRDRTNLMVFIRPRIISTPQDAREIAGPLYESLRDIQRENSKGGRSSLEDAVKNYLRAEPPNEPPAAAPLAPAPPAAPPAPLIEPPAAPSPGAQLGAQPRAALSGSESRRFRASLVAPEPQSMTPAAYVGPQSRRVRAVSAAPAPAAEEAPRVFQASLTAAASTAPAAFSIEPQPRPAPQPQEPQREPPPEAPLVLAEGPLNLRTPFEEPDAVEVVWAAAAPFEDAPSRGAPLDLRPREPRPEERSWSFAAAETRDLEATPQAAVGGGGGAPWRGASLSAAFTGPAMGRWTGDFGPQP